MTGFYGESDRSRRHVTWDLLRQLKVESQAPWVVVGDFNDITSLAEKRGLHSHPSALIEGFNDVLEDCGLADLGMLGGRFTWVKGRGTESWVEERLDRVMATVDWLELHEDAVVRNIYAHTSDHCAIFLDINADQVRQTARRFRFESAWMLEAGCTRVVDEAWRMSNGLPFQDRLAICGERLWKWGGEHHRMFGARNSQLRRTLDKLKEDRSPNAVRTFMAAEKELDAVLQAEEMF
ncbi:PREDICTED: uncharacterized protein LOC109191234 [Ipomoea nil]|uniref:uncharacterized protein LOC109191234 n=1 Tax=Ipomoea nil TaxID=35883 RepID=UPI0009015207|nr:PREDICTED: uncharacterized protein LOC109191234 [Ipomoea nil]